MTDRTIDDYLERKAIRREHVHTRRFRDEKHSTCICGEVWWTGTRWTPMPDRSQYMDELEGAARATWKGVEW